ncbi:Uncharacterized membrane protein YcfT [Auraticoccus monumenti]|uniref:Uncharacterized membrane protein YcfT n=1 Tax=Auraticoccus monumenti TaxID=675864 RepID=A0A1G6VUW9_9ACTN|nr:Uncharacterized membrane protein YcfT [Auraticoccus monumenti]
MAAPAARERAGWMDTLRGAAILLVILWHAPSVLRIHGFDVPGVLILLNETFAPYRMPVLMVLSGLLLQRSLNKPLGGYLLGKLRRILWPLLVWGMLNYALGDQETPVWSKVNWTTPYLWFLLYILLFYLVAPFLRPLPRWVPVLAPWVVSQLPGLTQDERRFMFLAGFFFLGALVAARDDLLQRVLAARATWLLALPVVAFSLLFVLLGPWRYYGVLAPFSVAGVLLAVKVARLPSVERLTGPLRFVGRHSIVYYCTHFPLLLALVWLAGRLALPATPAAALGVLVCLALGTLVARASTSPPVAWLFVAPWPQRSRAHLEAVDVPALRPGPGPAPSTAALTAVSAVALTGLLAVGIRFM